MSEGAAAALPPLPAPPMTCVIGRGLSSAGSISALRAIDTDTPSFTDASARLRLAGVMRFTAPI